MKYLILSLFLIITTLPSFAANKNAVNYCWQNVQQYAFYLNQKRFATQHELKRLESMKQFCNKLQSN